MGKTSIPELPRRTTRSSSLAESTGRQSEAHKISNSQLLKEKTINLDNLLHRFPGRRSQILEILQLIGPLNTPMLPLFIYGPPSTGKSSVVTQVLRHLNRPFIYSSCCSCYNPKILYEHVLNQFSLFTKNSKIESSIPRSCERASDFFSWIKDALTQLKKSTLLGNGKMLYLVFDSVEMIHHWDQGADFVSILFKLQDLLKEIEVGLIYISSNGPDCYYSNTGSMEPLPVFFPNYSEDEVYEIFMKNQANPKLYSSFLRVVLKPFYRVTRRLDELSIAFRPLFEKYCENLSDPMLPPDESMNRRLYDTIHPHIARSMDEIMKVSTRRHPKEKLFTKNKNGRNPNLIGVYDGLDFHLSLSSKYLLLSAFLASRNPPTLDSSMFDSTGISGNNKRKRKSSEASRQKNEHNMQLMVMKGPGIFSLERVLAIFQCINDPSDAYPVELTFEDKVDEDEGIGSTSDVLLQLTSLCKVNFIRKSSSCSLEGFTRYRCTIDEKTALKVARSINFPLSKYLYRG